MIRKRTIKPGFMMLLLFCFFFQANTSQAQSIERLAIHGPAGFIENKGQFRDQSGNQVEDLKFLYIRDGLKVQLLSNTISFDLFTMEEMQREMNESDGLTGYENIDPEDAPPLDVKYKSSRVDLEFIGANPNPQIEASECLPDFLNYYLSFTPANGIINVKQYNKITYKNLYNHVDLVVIASPAGLPHRSLAYDFVVHKGGNINDIRYRYHGADAQHLLQNGTLQTSNALGNLFEMIPASYLVNGAGEHLMHVPVSFKKKDGYISFEASSYDFNQTLVIDPVLVWATYCGGLSSDEGRGLAVDSEDNVIMTGRTYSTNNIASAGAYQSELNGEIDIMLEKYSNIGTRIWGTYYGGSGNDRARACIVNNAEEIYLGAHTTSTDGCTTEGTYQPNFWGEEDGLLALFTKDGHRTWATYYGGEALEVIRRLHLDADGNIVMVGYTKSDSGIATTDAWQQENYGGSDLCLSKWTANGDLIWSTYLGGESEDHGRSVIADKFNNIYINGSTGSKFGIKKNAYRDHNSGGQDYLLAKYGPSGNLKWCSYWGGELEDRGRGVYVDDEGQFVYFIGYTASDTGIITSGPVFQDSWTPGYDNNGQPFHDAVIMKWSKDGYPVWSTYMGGPPDDRGRAVTMIGDDVFLAGTTSSTDVVATPDGFQPEFGGNEDMFIDKFDKSGERVWGSYFGAEGSESTLAVAVDNDKEHIFMVGTASSETGISTPGVAQEIFGGFDDALLLKVSLAVEVGVQDPAPEKAMQIYPNPNQGNFTMHYQINEPATLHIYDVHGRVLHKKELPVATKKVNINNLNLEPGIYEAAIISGGEQIATSKLLVVK